MSTLSFVPLPIMHAAAFLPTYDPARERAWHLSIWASAEASAWCVHDLATGRCAALSADRGSAMPDEDRLPHRPVTVSFTALPELSTLVPESALAPGSEEGHLRTVHGALPTGVLRDEPIGALGARCLYLHDEQAEQRLVARFPNARPLPLQAVLVHTVLARGGEKPVVLLHRSAKRLDLAIARGQRLLLSNTFHAMAPEDALYYTLFALEQCGTRPEEARCLIGGTHLSAAEEGLLKKYLPDIAHAVAPADPPLAGLGLEAPHRFAALLEQHACAS